MAKKKAFKPKTKKLTAAEPAIDYGRVTITTLEALEQQSREHTANMTPEQRMEYLQKLREITHGTDMSEAEEIFRKSKIKINPADENT